MDYFVELASVPDVLEAIQRERDRKLTYAAQADELLLSDFLRDEHPSAWTAEIVRAFYRTPEFAAHVWLNLRYCESFRQRLSENKLRTENTWQWTKKEADPVIQPHAERFATEPDRAVKECADAIRDDICSKSDSKRAGCIRIHLRSCAR